ncbi:MAG: hypothetical protein J0I20_13560 [Chloroflexi bacterium]|nr:hypothetical protein [Chloroflexota bacterium]OJV92903.1 MAG: hypothetical protein BGO39_30190 [Chloroflexi bacterium 54-19]
MVAGVIFIGIQPIHPADMVSSVNTTAWAIITTLKTAMCFLFLLGIGGIYARQINRAGWLGLVGFLLLSLSWWLQTAFVFAETFIFPPLARTAPQFVDGLLAFISGRAIEGEVSLGALPTIYSVMGIFYMLGGLLLGVATVRARILPRWSGILLAVAATLTPLAAMLPHQYQRYAAVPVGLALAWMGLAVWLERRTHATSPVIDQGTTQTRQAVTE